MTDGSVVFDTKVDTDGFESGMRELEKAADSGLAQLELNARSSGDELQSILGGAMEKAAAAMKKALTEVDWKAMGVAVARGVESGVKSGEASLISRIKELASDMLRAVKTTLGIASPSAVFRDEVGLPVSQGIEQGVRISLPDAFDGIASLVDAEQRRLTGGLKPAQAVAAEQGQIAADDGVQRIVDAIRENRAVAAFSDSDVYEAYCRAQNARGYRLGD